MKCDIFPFSALTCWLGDRKGIRPVKKTRLIAPVVTSASIILCFNKHQLTQVHLEKVR